jgi:hypothetical protein
VIIITHSAEFTKDLTEEVWAVLDGRMSPSGHNWVAGQGAGPRLTEKGEEEEKFDAMGNKIESTKKAKKLSASELRKKKKDRMVCCILTFITSLRTFTNILRRLVARQYVLSHPKLPSSVPHQSNHFSPRLATRNSAYLSPNTHTAPNLPPNLPHPSPIHPNSSTMLRDSIYR